MSPVMGVEHVADGGRCLRGGADVRRHHVAGDRAAAVGGRRRPVDGRRALPAVRGSDRGRTRDVAGHGGAMDGAGARIGESTTGDRQEDPVVGRVVEGELHHAVRARRSARWSGGGVTARLERRTAGADGELRMPYVASARGLDQSRARLHRREALVYVVVALEQDVDAGRIQVGLQRLESRVVRDAGAVARLVPDGDDVLRRCWRRGRPQPELLGGAGHTAARNEPALGVEVDDVPVARRRCRSCSSSCRRRRSRSTPK